MEYGTFLLAILIAGAGILAVIIIKLLASLCNICRQRCEMFLWTSEVVSGNVVTQYQGESYSQRSVLNHYEETPQPVFSITPGSSEQSSLPSFMTPPPYNLATLHDEKPPAYEDVFNSSVNY